MVVCTGGSHIKANVPEAITITWEYMASLLPAQLSALAPFMPYIKPVAINSVSAFCSVDPPGWPSLTGLTFAAVLAGGEVGAGLVVADALAQILLNSFWYGACECTSMTTPAPPTPPTLPTIPSLNPPIVVQPPASGTCGRYGPGTATLNLSTEMENLIPQGALTGPGSITFSSGAVPVPTGVKTYTLSIDPGPLLSGGLHTLDVYVVHWTAAGTFVKQDIYHANAGTPRVDTATVGTTVAFMTVNANGYNDGGVAHAMTVSAALDFYCAQTPLTPLSPCCPPDPLLEGILTQILNLVTLIQRQAAPFAYVYGANHTGLTGHGSFAVGQLLGVSVDVTTIPSWGGRIDGSPVEYFDLGFVTLGTADGYEVSRRIDHDGSLVLPPSAGAFTAVGYTLEPGVVVDIRELVREP